MSDATGEIPQSDALAEAQPESLSELFSRDPEGYSQQDLDKVIALLREQRVRWAAAELAPKTPKAATAKVKNFTSKLSLEDLGL